MKKLIWAISFMFALSPFAMAQDKAKAAARATDDYVHDHPWRAVGIGALAGLVVGMLISRR